MEVSAAKPRPQHMGSDGPGSPDGCWWHLHPLAHMTCAGDRRKDKDVQGSGNRTVHTQHILTQSTKEEITSLQPKVRNQLIYT